MTTSAADSMPLFTLGDVAPLRGSSKLPVDLPSNAPELRLNSICPYYTMFPLRFPLRVLSTAKPGQRVLDPFAGRGTTLFAARLAGLSAVGIDSSPVAAHLSTAKICYAEPDEVTALAEKALATPADGETVPTGEFWSWAYNPATLEAVCRIRAHLLSPRSLGISPTNQDSMHLLRALMMGILHGPRTKRLPSYLSNQMPRTYATKPAAAVRYWEKNRSHPDEISVIDVVRRRAAFTLANLPGKQDGFVLQGDCREKLDSISDAASFDWVVTSPPYFGMRSYVPDQWLRNWFVGGSPDVDYSENGQIGAGNEESFVDALAEVWRKTAARCSNSAKLVIRFGSLPSLRKDPATLMKASLRSSEAWRIETIRSAGVAPSGRRQAEQFSSTGGYVGEVDVWAKKI